jgi:hypothetical protein
MIQRQRKRDFDLHGLFVKVKIWAIELAGTVVLLVWLFRAVMHELGVR